ncbi:hypothetical protein A9Q84_10085 [Halobacteriovorax marinus]|uniref:Uncharacterized protein n=1 Tax=Halobacteriovorax marinus TaxID=97084 RepID=A0A1Y5FDL8_9BACT|nr:hypothetical protein A9Q84_10085 [Halobacteriovorax marinus]
MTAKKLEIKNTESQGISTGEGSFYGSVLKFNLQEKKEVDQTRLPLSCYFKVKNHIELLSLGRNFHNSFKEGNRVFALTGFATSVDVEQTILGLGAYFNFDHGITCDLITPEFRNSEFTKLVKEDVEEKVKKWDNCSLDYHKTYSLTQYSITGLENIFKSVDLISFENILCDLFSKDNQAYFVALPDLKTIEDNLEFYYPILQHIDSVAISTELKKTKEKVLKKHMNYFEKSNIKIEGIILK